MCANDRTLRWKQKRKLPIRWTLQGYCAIAEESYFKDTIYTRCDHCVQIHRVTSWKDREFCDWPPLFEWLAVALANDSKKITGLGQSVKDKALEGSGQWLSLLRGKEMDEVSISHSRNTVHRNTPFRFMDHKLSSKNSLMSRNLQVPWNPEGWSQPYTPIWSSSCKTSCRSAFKASFSFWKTCPISRFSSDSSAYWAPTALSGPRKVGKAIPTFKDLYVPTSISG